MSQVTFYVSGHGFGHAVREAEVVRELLALAPNLRVEVRTTAPAFLFPHEARVVPTALDIGVVQPNSLDLWPDETLRQYAALRADEPARIEAQSAELRAMGTRLVVADVPPAAFAIAERTGIPSVAIANFSWDWIYEEYTGGDPRSRALVEHIRDQYRRASLLLRLPLSHGLEVFPRIEEIPLIARTATVDRATVRARLGVPVDRPLVLVSFGGIGFEGLDPARLASLDDLCFLVPSRDDRPLAPNVFAVPRSARDYPDILAASDVVLTKLGYGIVADCVANRVPMVYVPRGGFREEPVLEASVTAIGCGVAMPRAELNQGRLAAHLTQALGLRPSWGRQRVDGAHVAALRLLSVLDSSS